MIAALGYEPRRTVLEIKLTGQELIELHQTRARVYRELAKRAQARRAELVHQSRAMGPDAGVFERAQSRSQQAQLERMADVLELVASKLTPEGIYPIGDDLIDRLVGPVLGYGQDLDGPDPDPVELVPLRAVPPRKDRS